MPKGSSKKFNFQPNNFSFSTRITWIINIDKDVIMIKKSAKIHQIRVICVSFYLLEFLQNNVSYTHHT
jgi:hypothetical protein